MADYIITLLDAEDKAMQHIAYSVQDWIQNAANARAQNAINEIYTMEVERMTGDPNITTIPANKNQVVLEANIKTAKQIHDETLDQTE
jgi:hypothetical protein